MKTPKPQKMVVVGAGMTGLTTAALLARSGHQVSVLERDPAGPPKAQEAWETWTRPGVSQFRQPHLMLPRWYQEMRREFPELESVLRGAGAQQVNLLHLQAAAATRGWRSGDEVFDTLTARRPVLEAALCSMLGQGEHRAVVHRGVNVQGFETETLDGMPRVCAVRTASGTIKADVVIDAAGRHTRLPQLLREVAPAEASVKAEPSGFIYYARHYRSGDGGLPVAGNPVLTHYASLSALTIPCDAGTFCIVLVARSDDRALRVLRWERQWLAAVSAIPVAARWAAQGTPITPVMPIAGIQDVRRSYVSGGLPVALGMLAVGDASAATNPSLGRGASIGVLQACVLRDVLASAEPDPRLWATAYHEANSAHVMPWVEGTLRFDRHRLAEMKADARGIPYLPEDPAWSMTTALLRGAAHDPVLARAASRIASMLATPPEVFADPAVREKLGSFMQGPRYDAAGPAREQLLHALAAANAKTPVTRAS